MHTGNLVEIAAKLAVESGTLILGSRNIPERSLEQYWVASRCRLQHWQLELKAVEIDLRNHPQRSTSIWLKGESTMSEVLQAEVLTRVWSAILNGIEQLCPVKDCSPVGRSTLIGHLEARNRVLRLLMNGKSMGIAAVDRMNQIRLQTERWTDMLLSMIGDHADVANFGFEQRRVHQFIDERSQLTHQQRSAMDAVVVAAIKDYYHRYGCRYSEHRQLNQTLATAVLAAIDTKLFRNTGRLMPLWQTRMLLTTTETFGALTDLLNVDPDYVDPDSPARPTDDRQFDKRF